MTLDQRAHRIGRLRAFADPVVHALPLDVHEGRPGALVVVSEDFDERAVAGGAGIGDDDAEIRALLGTCATQTNGDHLTLLNSFRGSNPNACFAARHLVCSTRHFEPAGYPRLRSICMACLRAFLPP